MIPDIDAGIPRTFRQSPNQLCWFYRKLPVFVYGSRPLARSCHWAERLAAQRAELFGPHAKQTYLAREMQLAFRVAAGKSDTYKDLEEHYELISNYSEFTDVEFIEPLLRLSGLA